MALIGKIRKNFWFVLILLGFALAAFVIMDMTGASNRAGASDLSMGSVNGKKIDYKDFQITEGAYYGNSGGNTFAVRNSVWNFFVEKALIKEEAENLGVAVSGEEMDELEFGQNLSPIIQQNWMNQQTRQVDRERLNEIKTNIENGDVTNPQFISYWKEQKSQIKKEKLQSKINNIVSKAIYTPTWLAEYSFADDNTFVDFEYVKIPFDQINENVEVTDADYTNYINANRARFETKEETRTLNYLSFDVIPSKEDSVSIFNNCSDLAKTLGSPSGDSLFVINNNGFVSPIYQAKSLLPEASRDAIAALNVGEVYGPYEDQGLYFSVRMDDRRSLADSVQARHILRNADPTNSLQMASTEKFVDSLMTVLKRGTSSFDSLAIKHSQDPGSAFKGGDLGKFTQGMMVPPFNNVCFLTGTPGNYYKVKTQYGFHIIHLQDRVFIDREDKFKVSTIRTPIIPTEATQNQIYDSVSDLISEKRDITALQAYVDENPELNLASSAPLSKNDFSIGDLGQNQTSRDIVKWAFDLSSEVGDVSPEVYTFTDNVQYFDNKYVVAVLKSINPAGLPSADVLKDQIGPAVLNQKKGDALAASMSVSNLEDIATQYGSTVATANKVSLKSAFIPGIGNEKDVLGAAFSTNMNTVSKAIVGNSGVYVIKPTNKVEAGAPSNLPSIKKTTAQGLRSAVGSKLIQALKDNAKMEDTRSKYY